jgi:hypothetical protein
VCIVRGGVAGAFRWGDFEDGARGWSHIHIGFGGVWDYRAVEEKWGGKIKQIKNGGDWRWTAGGAVDGDRR